jgi:hypothetical protein
MVWLFLAAASVEKMRKKSMYPLKNEDIQPRVPHNLLVPHLHALKWLNLIQVGNDDVEQLMLLCQVSSI